jgi:hypothetical protein
MDFYKDELFIGSHPVFKYSQMKEPLYPAVGMFLLKILKRV